MTPRCGSAPATSRGGSLLRNGRAALPSPGGIAPRWARGSAPSPLRSRSQTFRIQTRSRRARIIRLSACAGLPAPCYRSSRRAGKRMHVAAMPSVGFRFLPRSARRGMSLVQRLAADTLSISLYNNYRYCRIFDTAFRYF